MAKAKWSVPVREIVLRQDPDGSLHVEVPLYDNGVKQLTHVLDVTAGRAVRVLVDGEPGAVLAGFTARSNITAAAPGGDA